MGADQFRVEELAERSGATIDTIRFYQKRRLLDPPRRDGRIAWYGTEHVERLAHIRDLRARGLTLALIGRLVRGELDPTDEPLAAAVAAEQHDGPSTLLTIDELATRSGIPVELLHTVVDAGLLAPRIVDGTAQFSSDDVQVLQAGIELIGTGLPMHEVLALARAHHERTRATAEEAVAMFDAHIRTPLRSTDLDDAAKAQHLVDAFRTMLPAVTALVEHHFRNVLLAVAQEHLEAVGSPTEIAAASVEAARNEYA